MSENIIQYERKTCYNCSERFSIDELNGVGECADCELASNERLCPEFKNLL